jgi:hypothetical protein
MPPQKLIDRSMRILKKFLVEMPACNTLSIGLKADDLIVILK